MGQWEETSVSFLMHSHGDKLFDSPCDQLYRNIGLNATQTRGYDRRGNPTVYHTYELTVGDHSVTVPDTETAERLIALLQKGIAKLREATAPKPEEET
jgi:hypothetical protein